VIGNICLDYSASVAPAGTVRRHSREGQAAFPATASSTTGTMAANNAARMLSNMLRGSRNATESLQQRRTICLACLTKQSVPALRRRYVWVPQNGTLPRTAKSPSAARGMATMADYRRDNYGHGPIGEYDRRVKAGRLRDDEHQRTLIQALQDLHDTLLAYKPPKVVHPTIESLQPKKKSFLGSLFGGGGDDQLKMRPHPSLPKGLYMYGDVGSGKTMLMDLFYDTLPPNIKHKTRIHFHNFMQEVHKSLHKMKSIHGGRR